jgi:predicted RNA-binding protein with EMAP domain
MTSVQDGGHSTFGHTDGGGKCSCGRWFPTRAEWTTHARVFSEGGKSAYERAREFVERRRPAFDGGLACVDSNVLIDEVAGLIRGHAGSIIDELARVKTELHDVTTRLATEKEMREACERSTAVLAQWADGVEGATGWPVSGRDITTRGVIKKLRDKLEEAQERRVENLEHAEKFADHDEQTRMQMAAIAAVALCNTPESLAKQRIDRRNPYWTPAYEEVVSAVERERAERERAEKAERDVKAAWMRANVVTGRGERTAEGAVADLTALIQLNDGVENADRPKLDERATHRHIEIALQTRLAELEKERNSAQETLRTVTMDKLDAEKAAVEANRKVDALEKELLIVRFAEHRMRREKMATHRCKVCKTLWIKFDDGWSVVAPETMGECCDNASMREQIEPIGLTADVERLRADVAVGQLNLRTLADKLATAEQEVAAWKREYELVVHAWRRELNTAGGVIHKTHLIDGLVLTTQEYLGRMRKAEDRVDGLEADYKTSVAVVKELRERVAELETCTLNLSGLVEVQRKATLYDAVKSLIERESLSEKPYVAPQTTSRPPITLDEVAMACAKCRNGRELAPGQVCGCGRSRFGA